ncbi:hypothetical protein Poli38472_009332 [Pythium oligandrum]|uniref:Cyclin N-terminal domain-containing protein n=1 Tax=Pythium oligandrum TaxID=41045 RepID=A0A8K1CM58_PYTOL|nr:hypothetical protein Poli38472_009332 [Pythium oligandrum]|eukprot:TMW65165.1 hypothetical protein Poli38472_009332 [Pythium oligandrum]
MVGMQDAAALSVSISPLLPSSIEEDGDARKRVHFEPLDHSFQPTHTVFTPKLSDAALLRYRKPVDRVSSLAPTSASSIVQPNYDDFLRRVSVVVYQHIRRCEKRVREQKRAAAMAAAAATQGLSPSASGSGSSHSSSAPIAPTEDTSEPVVNMSGNFNGPESIASPKLLDLPVDELFREEHFVTPQYKYTFIRLPRMAPITSYVMEKVTSKSHVPTVDEIYRFCKNLFNKAQLSAECTIVCLIYVERLMEQAGVPLLAGTWKPIVLCGLLLASKDLSSWNVEISNIYPQYPLHSINRLERLFLHHIQWDLYISGSNYAKYYFALRSLTEKKDFRRRYNYTMRVDPPNSKRLEERSAAIRHELYSKSL